MFVYLYGLFISVLVLVGIYFIMPAILKKNTGREPGNKNLLLVASAVFLVSWYLPTPLIEGQNTAFSTHFVGGGIFTGLVWLYLVRYLNLKMGIWLQLLSLYILVSGLGVTNELFELFIVKVGIANISGNDTWWDLLANNLGALFFWVIYQIFKK